MGFRFRKTIRLLPGVRINLSKSGVSTSFGGRGLTTNIGHGRRRTTVGLPGSGLSYRTEEKLHTSKRGYVVTVLLIIAALVVFSMLA